MRFLLSLLICCLGCLSRRAQQTMAGTTCIDSLHQNASSTYGMQFYRVIPLKALWECGASKQICISRLLTLNWVRPYYLLRCRAAVQYHQKPEGHTAFHKSDRTALQQLTAHVKHFETYIPRHHACL